MSIPRDSDAISATGAYTASLKFKLKVLDFVQLGGSERPGLSQACFRLALSNRAYRLQFDVSAPEVLASNPRLGSNPVLEDSAT